MAKRKSSPKAQNIAVPSLPERETVSIRKIANGYLVTHSKQEKNGGYSEVETYSAQKPDLRIPKGKKRA